MRTKTISLTRTLAVGTALLLATSAVAQRTDGRYRTSDSTTQNDQSGTAAVRIMRASDTTGIDVISSDGRRLGDITDFVFDMREPQRLAYVVVTTGGFLGMGGETRVIPAEAVVVSGDTARIQMSKAQYRQVPKLMEHPIAFLSNRENAARLADRFGITGGRQAESEQPRLVAFSKLMQCDVASKESGALGFVDDVWISFNGDRVPFVEITPMLDPFRLPARQYAIPMARVTSLPENRRPLTVSVSVSDLINAPELAEVEGVRMTTDGFQGNEVYRLTMPAVASATSTNQAGMPTGMATTGPALERPSSGPISAAQQIRAAFDADSQLRSSAIRVSPQNDGVVLSGTVASENIRDRAQQSAQKAAQGVVIQNQIAVQNQ